MISKQLKPSGQSQNFFKDLDEDEQFGKQGGDTLNFDIESASSKNLLKYLNVIYKQNFIYHILIMMGSNELGVEDSYYLNQNNQKVKKIGGTRLRALELLHSILVLLYPTLGPLSSAQYIIMGNDIPKSPHSEIELSRLIPVAVRRQLVKTLLLLMREYSYCSISNQLCIMVLDQIKTQFDVVDVVQLQKFVINEFRERHKLLLDMDKYNKLRGINVKIKRYQVDHNNMQSAQVNQMTTQLKDKVQQLQDFYKEDNRETAIALTGSSLVYDDLISADDRDFWAYLCKKDFVRLEKLQTQNIGEGHFIDDESSEDESEGDEDAKKAESESENHEDGSMDGILDFLEKKRSHVVKKRNAPISNRYQNENEENEEDFDNSSFIESMLNNLNDDSKQSEIQRQIKEEEEKQERLKQ